MEHKLIEQGHLVPNILSSVAIVIVFVEHFDILRNSIKKESVKLISKCIVITLIIALFKFFLITHCYKSVHFSKKMNLIRASY